ncbi:hypothetical protein LCGC14_0467580 [marine sediment metagenome]|uniref:T2SS protein K first SAM-like domain-containing protein n=1 Tax=marine sediment metagenome TaxID=412755 RepID=A0A0F9VM36_9ZZZZ|nr:hypothetical protein [Phycisphaerae bacterium]
MPPRPAQADSQPRKRRHRCRPDGTVLIVTMWLVLVLAGMVLVLARAMRVEAGASANVLAAQQAAAIEHGAIQYVLAHVAGLEGRMPSEQDMPSQAVQVGGGAFWILRPDPDDDRRSRYGVVDEASKINVNTATLEALMTLPEMTDDLAAGVIDWRDGDSDPTPEGAEAEYYLLLPTPYECKNAPLETVEELLLVNGWSPEILLGEDANRNGVLDDNENDRDEADPPDDGNGELDRGLVEFVTVYSAEFNLSASGERRVNINQANTQQVADVLAKGISDDRLAVVVVLARRGRPFANVLDFYFRVGLTAKEFAPIVDLITTSNDRNLVGLINVNTASREALAGLPELEEADVDALIAGRPEDPTEASTIAWVVDALAEDKALAIGSFITGRSFQFSANIVSVSGDGRAMRRCRIVVDARMDPPRVIYRQDLTSLGWPLSLEIIDDLRSGTPMQEVIERLPRETW